MTELSETLLRAELFGFRALLAHEGIAEKYYLYDLETHPLGQRAAIRTALDAVVDCRVVGGKSFLGHAIDISEGGMAVTGSADVRVGEHVVLVTVLPPGQQLLKLPGRVQWVRDGSFGVEFWPLEDPERSTIAFYQQHHRLRTSLLPRTHRQ